MARIIEAHLHPFIGPLAVLVTQIGICLLGNASWTLASFLLSGQILVACALDH